MNSNTHILIYPKHLPVAVEFARRSHQRFLLDHLAKPPIKTGELRPWEVPMRELARLPNVFCKLSGLVTEAVEKLKARTHMGSSQALAQFRRNQASPDAPLSRCFTQDCAISLNPSRSGPLRTAQGVSKYIVARCSEVYAGQCGSPL
jgi:hypothetical protein